MSHPTRSGQNRVYLAGPMTGIADFNYPMFNHYAEQLRAKGWVIENPAENKAPECNSWPGYMRLALRQMLTCDMVVFLPDWGQSKGAQLEHQVARRLSMPTFEIAEVL